MVRTHAYSSSPHPVNSERESMAQVRTIRDLTQFAVKHQPYRNLVFVEAELRHQLTAFYPHHKPERLQLAMFLATQIEEVR